MAEFNEMQTIKRHFFAMRNGAVADNMRRHGAKYRIIFGLNLPQITEIAHSTQHSCQLAEKLWQNQSTRESMLMAPMIYPRENFNLQTAIRWISEIPSAEVADVLCLKLLRHLDYAWQLSTTFNKSQKSMERYTALRLMFNLLPAHINDIKNYAIEEMKHNEPLTSLLCLQIIDEIDFLSEDCNFNKE